MDDMTKKRLQTLNQELKFLAIQEKQITALASSVLKRKEEVKHMITELVNRGEDLNSFADDFVRDVLKPSQGEGEKPERIINAFYCYAADKGQLDLIKGKSNFKLMDVLRGAMRLMYGTTNVWYKPDYIKVVPPSQAQKENIASIQGTTIEELEKDGFNWNDLCQAIPWWKVPRI